MLNTLPDVAPAAARRTRPSASSAATFGESCPKLSLQKWPSVSEIAWRRAYPVMGSTESPPSTANFVCEVRAMR